MGIAKPVWFIIRLEGINPDSALAQRPLSAVGVFKEESSAISAGLLVIDIDVNNILCGGLEVKAATV
jgi:hypothetical protein